MRPGSQELDEALGRGVRSYATQVRMGGLDVTDESVSWSLDRAFSTGLPDSVAAPVGAASAQARVDFQGGDGKTAAQKYSPWGPRSTADVTRPGQSCVLSWGLQEQAMQAFRGRVRKVDAAAGAGSATVTALDGAEILRGAYSAPPCVAHMDQGIQASWLVDHALRMSGIYASPPPRQSAMYQVFFASMHGSLEANLGMRESSSAFPSWDRSRSPWTSGPVHDQGDGWEVTWHPQRRVLSQVTRLVVEWWVYRRDTSDTDGSQVSLQFQQYYNSSNSDTVSVGFDPGLRLWTEVNGNSTSWATDTQHDQAGRYKVAFEVYLPSLSSPVRVRGRLYLPDGTEFATPYFDGPGFGNGLLYTITAGSRSPMECINVSRIPSSTWSTVEDWQRGAEIDLMRETTSAGLATYGLSAIPYTDGTWWDVLKEIASDTMSYMYFDEDGVFHFRRYDYLRLGTELPPDLELTSRRDISGLSVGEESDALANLVGVGATRYSRSDQYTETYGYGAVIEIPPGGERGVNFNFGNQRPWKIYAPMMYYEGDPAGINGVTILTSDGLIAPVEVELRYNGGFPLIAFYNRGSDPAYTATSSSLAEGSLILAHTDTTSERVTPVTRSDEASRARYGDYALDVASSDWVQSAFFADNLASQILEWTASPIPLLGDVDILPDPRIQLGDVVRLRDTTGAMVDGLFRILGYRVKGNGPSVSMSISVRPLYRPDAPVDEGLTTEPILDPAAPELPG